MAVGTGDGTSDGWVKTRFLLDDAVTTAKIIDDAVTAAKIADGTITTALMANPASYSPGEVACAILRVALDGADGELVTIDSDVYEVEPLATDSTDDTANGDWNNTTNPLSVPYLYT